MASERPVCADGLQAHVCLSVDRPGWRCLLKLQSPLVVLLYPQVGDMLITRRHSGGIAFRHVNDAIVGDDGGIFADWHYPQIVGVIIFEFAFVSARQNFCFVVELTFTTDRYALFGQ